MKVNVIPHDARKNTHFLVIADLHESHLDRPTFDIMLKYARIYNINGLIINGDFLDLKEFMSAKNPEFSKWVGRSEGIEEYFLPALEASCFWGASILDELQKVFKNIFYLFGNHETRIGEFQSNYCPSEYKHHFDISVKLELEKRGIKHFEYNDWVDIGAVSLTHGMYHNATHFKKHYESSEARNVIIGHLHRSESMCFTSRGKTKKVSSIGCMSTLNPVYMKNRDNNWVLGFCHIVIKPDGHYNKYDLEVWDNELVLPDGRVLK